MLDLAVRAFALLAAASAAAPLLGRAAPAVRHLYWHAAILATLSLPLVLALAPQWTFTPTPFVIDTVADVARSIETGSSSSAVDRRAGAERRPPSSQPRSPGLALLPALKPVVEAVWLAGTALVALFFTLGYARVWRIRRDAAPAPLSWNADARRVGARLRLRTVPEVLMSSAVPGPLTTGWLTPVLLIPAEADKWSADRREAVVAHELAHVARRDCRTQLAAQIVCALHWFNPLVWHAASRLRRERERACDAEVLRLGITASTYAAELLAIASGVGHRRAPIAALAMARRSELEGRLLAVLAGSRPRRSTAAGAISALTMAALAVAVAGAGAGSPMAQALPPHPLAAPPIALTMATGGASRSDAAPADSAAAASASAQGQGQRPPQSGTDGSAAMADHPEALDALLKALDDPSAQVREKAALAVGFWPDASAGEALIRALTDPDAQVREKAAIGLAMRRRPGAVGPLIAVLRDSDPQVREKAAIALGTTGSREAWTALANAMNDPDPQVREKVAAALILLKTDSAGIAENETLSAAVRLGLRLLEGLVK